MSEVRAYRMEGNFHSFKNCTQEGMEVIIDLPNDSVLVQITRNTEPECRNALVDQLTDGVFEDYIIWNIEEISNENFEFYKQFQAPEVQSPEVEQVEARSWEQQLADAQATVLKYHRELDGNVFLANDIESWEEDGATVEVVESDKKAYMACKIIFDDGVTVKVYTNRYALETMPFDRYEDGRGFIHHTGYVEYDPEDGGWWDVWDEE